MDSQARLALLESENTALERALRAEREAHATTQAQRDALTLEVDALALENLELAAERAKLVSQLAEAMRRAHGKSSERVDPGQLLLDFDEIARGIVDALAAAAAADDPKTTAPDDEESLLPPKERRKRSRSGVGVLNAEVEEREVLPREEERCCAECGTLKERIGEEVSEELIYVPAHVKVVRRRRIKFACKTCVGQVSVAPAPRRPIPRSKAGASLLAHVVVAKFVDHLPLYRQEKMLKRVGVLVSRSTLCEWVGGVARLLEPVLEAMRNQVLSSGYVRADETTIRVQPATKKGRTEQCYLWGYLGGGQVVFDFTGTRARDGPNRVLKTYSGHLQCDGYVGYDEVCGRSEVVRMGCWAHVRRYFFEAFDAGDKRAALALGLIGKLYAVERAARQRDLDPAEVLALREEHARPAMEALRSHLVELGDRVLPASGLGKAIGYAKGQWSTLEVYLGDGRLGIDNNPIENAIRGIAVGRKNWLFAGNHEGGRRAAAIYSLVESAKLCGVDPSAYLTDVIGRVADTPVSKVVELTPVRWAAARTERA